jgi:glycosyltransferase involved in cell wall biosynthesis
MPGPFRILHVIDSLNLGGAQSVLRNIAAILDKKRFQIDVAALHGPGTLHEVFVKSDISPHYLAKSKYDPRIPFRLKTLIQRNKYDLVHAHLVPSCFICDSLRMWLGIEKLVEHEHSMLDWRHSSLYQNLLRKIIYRKCDIAIACSLMAQQHLPSATKKVVVYNGVDEEKFKRKSTQAAEAVRTRHNLKDTDFLLIMIGRLAPVKDPKTLCNAVKLLEKDIPDLKVVFVGSGPLEKEIRTLILTLGLEDRFVFAGQRTDVKDYLSVADVYVISSLLEGLPMALVEAMISEVPAIVSDFAAASEVIVPEENALQFARGDARGLADQILRYYHEPDLRAAFAREARQRAENLFSLQAMAQRIDAVYRELLE